MFTVNELHAFWHCNNTIREVSDQTQIHSSAWHLKHSTKINIFRHKTARRNPAAGSLVSGKAWTRQHRVSLEVHEENNCSSFFRTMEQIEILCISSRTDAALTTKYRCHFIFLCLLQPQQRQQGKDFALLYLTSACTVSVRETIFTSLVSDGLFGISKDFSSTSVCTQIHRFKNSQTLALPRDHLGWEHIRVIRSTLSASAYVLFFAEGTCLHFSPIIKSSAHIKTKQ